MEPDRKTWGRELALALLAGWLVITVRVFFLLPATDVPSYDGSYGGVTVAIFGLVTAVFLGKRYETTTVQRERIRNPRLSGAGEHERAG